MPYQGKMDFIQRFLRMMKSKEQALLLGAYSYGMGIGLRT